MSELWICSSPFSFCNSHQINCAIFFNAIPRYFRLWEHTYNSSNSLCKNKMYTMKYTTKKDSNYQGENATHLWGKKKAKPWNRQIPDFLIATQVFSRAALFYNLCLWTTELTAVFAQPQGCVLTLAERGQNVWYFWIDSSGYECSIILI